MKRLFPITITTSVTETKDFYIGYFNFEVVFEEDWYVHMRHSSGVELAMMLPNQDNQPQVLHGNYNGEGIVYSLEVDDATDEYNRLKDIGAKFILDLTDESWGQRHFMLRDPAGVVIDVVEQL